MKKWKNLSKFNSSIYTRAIKSIFLHCYGYLFFWNLERVWILWKSQKIAHCTDCSKKVEVIYFICVIVFSFIASIFVTIHVIVCISQVHFCVLLYSFISLLL